MSRPQTYAGSRQIPNQQPCLQYQNRKPYQMKNPIVPTNAINDCPPVMAYVPWQQWGDLYEPDCGIKQGTIFKDLNYIFCGTRC
ncbi:MAG: spore coat associated protein CotJA [Lachnospiraceae bacterium]|nr:spore coat associated protein CotJA [Lachnospiraceae bacterium]